MWAICCWIGSAIRALAAFITGLHIACVQTSPISFVARGSLIVFQRPAGFPRSWEHAVIGWHTVRIVWLNAGCYWIWSDNVCSDLCNRGFPVKTNQNMCHCVQTIRNLVRGRGKFNVCEEIICLQFTAHDTSHHICKQFLRKLQERHGLRTRQAFRRKPAKETRIFI